jgi:hypothetical protein
MNAAKTPEVLIFEIRPVTITVHFQCYLILTSLQIVGDVKFTWLHTALAIPYPFAIDPNIKGTHYALKP